MKLLTLLISSILLAESQHNFKAVSFYGKTLDDVFIQNIDVVMKYFEELLKELE